MLMTQEGPNRPEPQPIKLDRKTTTIDCAEAPLDGANATLDRAHGIDDRAIATSGCAT